MSQQSQVTIKATPAEIQAVDRIITAYVNYIEGNLLPTSERAIVIATLHQLQSRLQRLALGDDGFLTLRITFNEAIVLGQAVLVYQQMLKVKLPVLPRERQDLRQVQDMQRRFLESTGKVGLE